MTKSRTTTQGRGQRPLGSLNSTDVTAQLYFRGIRIDRRRLAWVADALWPNGDLRESNRLPRFYTPEQVDQVGIAFTLLDSGFGIQISDIAKAAREVARRGGGALETIQATVRARHEALDIEVRARHEALDALAERLYQVAQAGPATQLPLPDESPSQELATLSA